MTLQARIDMVHTLKEIESMFEHVKDAKYIIALKYCRQSLEHEIRVEKLFEPVNYNYTEVDSVTLQDFMETKNEFGEFIKDWIESEVNNNERR